MKRVGLSVACLMLFSGTHVAAQNPSDMGIPFPAYNIPDRASAVELRHVGGCLARTAAGSSAALLLTEPGSDLEASRVHFLGSKLRRCISIMSARFRYDAAGLRGAIAEAFYLARYQSPPSFSDMPTRAALPAAWTNSGRDEHSLSLIVAQDSATCIVDKSPSDADALVRTDPVTAEEKTIIRRLARALGPCLIQGVTFSTDRRILRAVLAEALYRRAVLSPGGPQIAERVK